MSILDDTATPRALTTLDITPDECGNDTVPTPVGPLTWVERDSDGGLLADPHFQLGDLDLGDATAADTLRAALDAMRPIATRQRFAPHTAAIASQLRPGPRTVLLEMAAGERSTDGWGAPVWNTEYGTEPLSEDDIDHMETLRRHGLVAGWDVTALGEQVADFIDAGDSVAEYLGREQGPESKGDDLGSAA